MWSKGIETYGVNVLSGWEPHPSLVTQPTYLIGKGASTEITKRKLESAVATLDIDLEGDKSVGVSC